MTLVGHFTIGAVESIETCGQFENPGSHLKKLAVQNLFCVHSLPFKVLPSDYDILGRNWLPESHKANGQIPIQINSLPDAAPLILRLLPNYLFYVLFAFLMVQTSFAHELVDGFVERAMEVVVRDENVTIRYFIGVNDNTQSELAKKWLPANQMSDETGLTDEQVFQSKLLQEIKEGISVSLQGKKILLADGEVCQSPKHHFSYLVEFKFDIPPGSSNEIEIEDNNFQEMESAARFSLKALGSTILVKSNVAPIIIRAKRHELQRMADGKRSEICKIRATVVTDNGQSS